MKRPWMPLYVGDYLGDTGHLTTAQHGAYLLLMMHYWRKGELPDDDRQLAKITKLPLRSWRDYRATLQDFFYDGWRHKRIDAELQRMTEVSAKRAIAGQQGGLGSALARMKLEDQAIGRSDSPRANAMRSSGMSAAISDHSDSDSHKNLLSIEAGTTTPEIARSSPREAAIPVSPELAAYVARRSS